MGTLVRNYYMYLTSIHKQEVITRDRLQTAVQIEWGDYRHNALNDAMRGGDYGSFIEILF